MFFYIKFMHSQKSYVEKLNKKYRNRTHQLYTYVQFNLIYIWNALLIKYCIHIHTSLLLLLLCILKKLIQIYENDVRAIQNFTKCLRLSLRSFILNIKSLFTLSDCIKYSNLLSLSLTHSLTLWIRICTTE